MTDDIRIRIHWDDKKALQAAAAARGVPLAEHVRALLKRGDVTRPFLHQVNEDIREGRIVLPLSLQLRRTGRE